MNKSPIGLALLFLAVAIPSHAQSPAWSGSARCDVTITGPGYTDRQTHAWQTSAGAPTARGAFTIYPGTWGVSGGGSLERTTGDQTLRVQWTRSVAGMNGPISVVMRASDGVVLIQPDHAQLRGRGAVSGTQEVLRGGRVISSSPIAAEAFEYTFPSIKGTSASTHLAGQTSDTPKGSFGFMQPGDSRVQVNCAWDFRRADFTGGSPPNPATLPTSPVETGSATPPTTPTSPVSTAPVTPTGSGNAPVQIPSTLPASSNCETQLAESQAAYDLQEAANERQFNQLLAAKATERAALVAERVELRTTLTAEGNYHPTGNPFAQIDAQIAKVDSERAALEKQKIQAIAAVRRGAARAASDIRLACAGGGPK
ncbi:MAG: hypothetical protein ABI769_14290 [Pseudomonadota bacterium]